MAKFFLKRTLAGFSAADESAAESMRRYKIGEIYKAEVVKPRNYKHHCLCMALLTLTYQNLPEKHEGRWKSFDDFRYGVAVDAGHCLELVTPRGEVFKQARSVSYEHLDEVEFSEVMPRLMDVCGEILRLSQPELEAEISRYASEHYGMAA